MTTLDLSLMSFPAVTPAEATGFTRFLAQNPDRFPVVQYRASSDRHSLDYILNHGRAVMVKGVETKGGKVWLDTRTKDGEIIKAGLSAFIFRTDESTKAALEARAKIGELVELEANPHPMALKHRILALLTKFWPLPEQPAAQVADTVSDPATEFAF
jgi:hypothetical protein